MQLERHPGWCKLVMLKGLLWDVAPSARYEWVVSLDVDAVFNAPESPIEAWLSKGAKALVLATSILATTNVRPHLLWPHLLRPRCACPRREPQPSA